MIRHAIVEELAGLGAAIHKCSRNEAELNSCTGVGAERFVRHWFGLQCIFSSPKRVINEYRLHCIWWEIGHTCKFLHFHIEIVCRVFLAFDLKNRSTFCHFSCKWSHLSRIGNDDYQFWLYIPLVPSWHPLLKASGCRSIVFISSIGGVVSLNVGSTYAASKGNSIV